MRIWIAFAIGLVLAACAPPREAPPADGRLPATVTPLAYALTIDADPRAERFSGEARISVKFAQPTTGFWLHGKGLTVSRAALKTSAGELSVRYEESAALLGWAYVALSGSAPKGEAELTIIYSAAFATSVGGLYRMKQAGEYYLATQFEAVDARRMFPSFDEPRFKTPFSLTVVAPTGQTVAANTPELKSEDAGKGKTRHVFAPSEPLPTYLVELVVGPYDVVEAPALPPNAVRNRAVPLRGIAPKGKGARLKLALEKAPVFVDWFETYFATPYPYAKLDIIALPELGGAMENAAAITYDESVILLGADAPVAQLRDFAITHAHEISHQWFGDLVTPSWWDDIWLNEAFATWMEVKATNAVMPELGMDREIQTRAIRGMRTDSLSAARRIREPIRNEADINDAFDSITYSKGGAVLAMAESYLGADAFREGVRLHMRRFPHGVATTKDFFESLAQASGKPEIIAALDSFTTQSHVPLIGARLDCAQPAPALRVAQSTYAPLGTQLPARTWTVPLCVSAYPATGAPSKTCTMLSAKEGTVPLSGSCPTMVAPNADGAGYYRFALHDAGWTAANAGFARLSPGEQIAALDSADAAFRAGKLAAATLAATIEKAAAATDAGTRQIAIDKAKRLEWALGDAELPAYRAWVLRVFGLTAFRAQGANEAERAVRKDLTTLLALQGRSPDVRQKLLASARSTLGLAAGDGTSADLRQTALIVAIQDGGPEAFARLLERAKGNTDAQFRQEALAALGHAPRSEDQQAFAAAITSDAFTDAEMFLTLSVLLPQDRDSAPLAWSITRDHFGAIVKRAAAYELQLVPRIASGLCSAADQSDVAAFFAANGKKLPGHERSLALTVETIGICATLRQDKGAEVAGALALGH